MPYVSPIKNVATQLKLMLAGQKHTPSPLPKRVVVGGVDRLVLTKPTTGNSVTFHVTPTESDQAILNAIKTAKRSFYIETFIWHNDAAGREIAQALIDRKREVEARGGQFDAKVLIDWLGLRDGSGGADDLGIIDMLREGGIEVREFGDGYIDTSAKGLAKIAPITHRKLYIQDGSQFTTGGRNIGNEYLKPTYSLADGEQEASWHDLLYTVKGSETGRVIEEFYKNWEHVGGTRPARPPVIVPDLRGTARVQSVVTDPHGGSYGLRQAHQKAIAGATKEIVAIYPYFSDDELVHELIAAKKARPNLSVKVLMPANKEASHEGSIYSILNRETAKQLLEAGIEVRLFDGGTVKRFSHMKAMMFDNKVLSLGSANGDQRTYEDNHELNTLIADDKAVASFRRKVVDPDWAAAEPLTLDQLAQDSFWVKLKRKVFEFFDFLL